MLLQQCFASFSIVIITTLQHTNAMPIQNDLAGEDFKFIVRPVVASTISFEDFSEQVNIVMNRAKKGTKLKTRRKYTLKYLKNNHTTDQKWETTSTSTHEAETRIKIYNQESGQVTGIKLDKAENLESHSKLAIKKIKNLNFADDDDMDFESDTLAPCQARSTVYNRPRVKSWLNVKTIHSDSWNQVGWAVWMNHRPLYMDLRRQLYTMGRSEECHTAAYDRWGSYIHCALRRNQRMEYFIPKYPMHQVGYHFETKDPNDDDRIKL